jgi:biotin operon repressor
MNQEFPADLRVEGWLRSLKIDSLAKWDVLVFMSRHPTSLLSVEQIARLIGYANDSVLGALDALESLGLVVRSRVDQGVRLYQFTAPTDRPRGDTLDRLLTLADSRPGRLILAKQLKRSEQLDPKTGQSCSPLAEGDAPWRKAI